MQLPFLRRLYAHMEWADAHIWRAVDAGGAVRDDDYVVDSLVHLHMVQRAYLAVWTDREVVTPTRADFGDLAEIRDWARSYHVDAGRFVEALTEERLAETPALPWTAFIEKEIGGPPAPAAMADMVCQVAAHSGHHRAQVNRRIRELGGSPGLIDYIGWIWRGSPAAQWPT